ncbi:drug/metabolite transporter (DMT)-like permease [Azospirillum soli]|nr:drug/metabolite transporter (DMT)-like permease [Azospirillum soli]
MTAYSAVFVNIKFTEVSAILITFSTFFVCWFVFLTANRARLGALVALWRSEKRSYLMVNIATLLSWMGMFSALKLVNAPVQTVVYMSIIPLVTVVLGGEWRRLSALTRLAVGVIGVLGMVVAYTHPSMADFAINRQFGGVLLALGAGACGAVFIVSSSALQKRHSLSTNDLICIRLPILLLFTGAISLPELVRVFSLEFVGKALFLSAVAVMVPVWMLQQSITKIGGVRTSVLIPLVPITALALEWREGVTVSFPALVAICLQCAAIMWTSLSLARARQAVAAAPTGTPAGAPTQASSTVPVTAQPVTEVGALKG